ncbi:hypothetical protein BDZ91DRAFT_720645 [Kalaharituber pfeilii]|nr:hypothetical protein BDZ91DRAFT_720645 [Kalaharituber pfeilii]
MQPPLPKRRRIDAPLALDRGRPTKAPTKSQLSSFDDEILLQRAESQHRLKSAWESIFAKYARDTSDYADEIDLETGEIVVDRGHLRGLQAATETGIAVDLWRDWVREVDGKGADEDGEGGDRDEDGKSRVASGGFKNGLGHSKDTARPKPTAPSKSEKLKGSTKPIKHKRPKVVVVAGIVIGVTECELCAEKDELDFTPCTHNQSSDSGEKQHNEKENKPGNKQQQQQWRYSMAPPKTPTAQKVLYPAVTTAANTSASICNQDNLEDELSTPGMSTLRRDASGLTPALDTMQLNSSFSSTSSAIYRPKRPPASTLPQHQLPSSPIVRHISNRTHQPVVAESNSCIPSSPSLVPRSSPQSCAPQKPTSVDPWAPLDDDPLIDKTWHSHHPDGSPPRPQRVPLFGGGLELNSSPVSSFMRLIEGVEMNANEETGVDLDEDEDEVESKTSPPSKSPSKSVPQKTPKPTKPPSTRKSSLAKPTTSTSKSKPRLSTITSAIPNLKPKPKSSPATSLHRTSSSSSSFVRRSSTLLSSFLTPHLAISTKRKRDSAVYNSDVDCKAEEDEAGYDMGGDVLLMYVERGEWGMKAREIKDEYGLESSGKEAGKEHFSLTWNGSGEEDEDDVYNKVEWKERGKEKRGAAKQIKSEEKDGENENANDDGGTEEYRSNYAPSTSASPQPVETIEKHKSGKNSKRTTSKSISKTPLKPKSSDDEDADEQSAFDTDDNELVAIRLLTPRATIKTAKNHKKSVTPLERATSTSVFKPMLETATKSKASSAAAVPQRCGEKGYTCNKAFCWTCVEGVEGV